MNKRKTRRFRCSRCREMTTTIYYWDDGRFHVICKDCKTELESGAPRVMPKEEELLI